MESTNLGIVPWSPLKKTCLPDIMEVVWGCSDLRSEGLVLVRKCFGILLLES